MCLVLKTRSLNFPKSLHTSVILGFHTCQKALGHFDRYFIGPSGIYELLASHPIRLCLKVIFKYRLEAMKRDLRN